MTVPGITVPGVWEALFGLLGLALWALPIVLVVYAVILLRRVDRKLDAVLDQPLPASRR